VAVLYGLPREFPSFTLLHLHKRRGNDHLEQLSRLYLHPCQFVQSTFPIGWYRLLPSFALAKALTHGYPENKLAF
jgi:hypothetical protein